ncbi:MAG: hypothetical protein QGH53_05580 [Prochlorococcaceae cyanobacterium ETNP18_MAG_1]|nr:hypothetical protein [Prochlorococcaceae cyanobacterium ETNP18_MAG_1]
MAVDLFLHCFDGSPHTGNLGFKIITAIAKHLKPPPLALETPLMMIGTS